MSYKSENWKEILEDIRAQMQEPEVSEKTQDEVVSEEIDALLEGFEDDVLVEMELAMWKAGNFDPMDAKNKKQILSLAKKHKLKVDDKDKKHLKLSGKAEGILKLTQTLFNQGKEPGMDVTKEEVEPKSTDKLTEKNMLGRLAKSMELTEDNKQKLFDYFDKGELEQ